MTLIMHFLSNSSSRATGGYQLYQFPWLIHHLADYSQLTYHKLEERPLWNFQRWFSSNDTCMEIS